MDILIKEEKKPHPQSKSKQTRAHSHTVTDCLHTIAKAVTNSQEDIHPPEVKGYV